MINLLNGFIVLDPTAYHLSASTVLIYSLIESASSTPTVCRLCFHLIGLYEMVINYLTESASSSATESAPSSAKL
jgi:hypothetical protein